MTRIATAIYEGVDEEPSLEKLGAVTGISNHHIYAAMRGETLEEFQQSRNAPGALYSVAGKDAPNLSWDQKTADMKTAESSLKL